jgi:hypothetical protein
MAAIAADQDHGVTGIGAADAGHVVPVVDQADAAMVGVGRMPTPLVSL